MAWSFPKPQDTWSDREKTAFLRDIWVRERGADFTFNPPNLPTYATIEVTLDTTDAPEVDGLRVGMQVSVTPPSTLNPGIVVSHARVDTDNTLTIRLENYTNGDLNPASGTWSYKARIP